LLGLILDYYTFTIQSQSCDINFDNLFKIEAPTDAVTL